MKTTLRRIKPDSMLRAHLAELIRCHPCLTQHSLTGTIFACREGADWVFYCTR